jgi:type IV pilus assembly protein PilQ
MKKIIMIVFLINSYAYSQTQITDVEVLNNKIVIKYIGEPRYSISNLEEKKGIKVEFFNSFFKMVYDKPIDNGIITRIVTSQENNKGIVTAYTKLPVSYKEEKSGKDILLIDLIAVPDKDIKDAKIIPPSKPYSTKTQSSKTTKDLYELLPSYKIDLEYTDADIRDVITHLLAKAQMNVIFSDDVIGSVSISLKNVPFNEAFKTLLSMKGLIAQKISQNIVRISTKDSLLNDQKNAYLQTKVFFLNYVKASEIKSQIESIAQAEGRTTAKCNVDDTNNALIVTDTPIGLEMVSDLISKLDKMPKQVLIEAKLVEVSLDSALHQGIQWSISGNSNGNYIGAQDAASAIGPQTKWGGPKTITPGYGGSYTGTPPNLLPSQGGSGVELPANVIYGAFRFGRITPNFMFDAVISAAAKKGKANVLSNPKIATLNNKEASINITNQIPYLTTEITNTPGGSVSSTKVTYVTTGIILKVLPTITSDGKIIMKINPTVSQPSQTAPFQPPSVDQRTADTTVVVSDGETIVIGGLIHDSESEYEYKVPFLGDVPMLGYLFKKKGKERNRMELLIFVTPKIVE